MFFYQLHRDCPWMSQVLQLGIIFAKLLAPSGFSFVMPLRTVGTTLLAHPSHNYDNNQ